MYKPFSSTCSVKYSRTLSSVFVHLVQSAFSAEFKMLLTGAHPIGPLAFSTFNSGNDSCENV